MSGWVPGSIGLCVPTAAAPPGSRDFGWSWSGFNGKTQRKRGLTGTPWPGSCRKGGGQRGGLLRPGKSLCNFSRNAEGAEGGQRRSPGALCGVVLAWSAGEGASSSGLNLGLLW